MGPQKKKILRQIFFYNRATQNLFMKLEFPKFGGSGLNLHIGGTGLELKRKGEKWKKASFKNLVPVIF